jgi:hypothetical protein
MDIEAACDDDCELTPIDEESSDEEEVPSVSLTKRKKVILDDDEQEDSEPEPEPTLKRTKTVRKKTSGTVMDQQPTPFNDDIPGKKMKSKGVFLTYPRIPQEITKEQILDALNKIITPQRGGKPNQVVSGVIAKEHHEDGGTHFHAALKLQEAKNWSGHTWDLTINEVTYHGNYQSMRSLTSAVKYCKKEGDYLLIGDFDPDAMEKAAKGHRAYLGKALQTRPLHEVAEEHPEMMFNYCQLKEAKATYEQDKHQATFSIPELRWKPWQQEVLDLVEDFEESPSNWTRTVVWIVDPDGGAGKSTLTKHLVVNKNALPCLGNKKDVYFLWDAVYNKIGVFDFPRQKDDHYDYCYSMIEELKNGMIMSGKYVSKAKTFASPFIICFSNWWPNTSMLSHDRWKVYEMIQDEDEDGAHTLFPLAYDVATSRYEDQQAAKQSKFNGGAQLA